MAMDDLLIPPLEPWDDFPAEVSALLNVVHEHQEREEPCGDHSVETCSCGAPHRDMPNEVWEAGAAARRDWRESEISKGHHFRWRQHFAEKWNEVIQRP